MTRFLAMGSLVVFGTAWSAALVLIGLWAVLDWSRRWPEWGPACVSGGLAAVVAGEFVFLAMVADKVFPGASPRLVAAAELASGLLFLALCAVTAGLLFLGG